MSTSDTILTEADLGDFLRRHRAGALRDAAKTIQAAIACEHGCHDLITEILRNLADRTEADQ